MFRRSLRLGGMNDITLEAVMLPAIMGGFAFFALLDTVMPARAFPRITLWRVRGVAYLLTYLILSSVLPFVWDEFLGAHRLIDATSLGTAGGAVVGLFTYHLFAYGWHRWMHHSNFLFRVIHQMHHSSERIDIWSALIFSPLGMVMWTFVASFALVFVVGITAPAAMVIALVNTFLAYWQHANLRTPRWIGYIIVRPESHTLHHHRGVHAYNYSDLPVIDMIFGTFRNPTSKEADKPVGFYEGASNRVLPMLVGMDVSKPRVADPQLTPTPSACSTPSVRSGSSARSAA